MAWRWCSSLKETASRLACEQELERSVRAEGQTVLGWRDVPVDVEMPMSPRCSGLEPVIRQLFIGRGADVMVPDALERKLYVIRRTASHAIQNMRLALARNTSCPRLGAHRGLQKACCYQGTRSAATIATWPIRARCRRWRWCTSASTTNVPRLAAGPPVPHDRPQRRNQHGQGALQRLRALKA